ncbi:PilC/PilY family type IV pilus protein [Moraxella oblonga]|uniref:PilC/PilY family type IV pilus protein n=1 Tax=Moraxella oblonga TaxID=200413 RepID=UPI000B181D36|nr:PilC/PilY family type IV pilus protein [Moraxella oblonga]
MKKFNIKTLALSLSAVMTATTVMPQAQASDIEIYREATAGATSLVFMLDISGSMDVGSVADDYLTNTGQALNWANDRGVSGAKPAMSGNTVLFYYWSERGFSGYTRDYRRVLKAEGDRSKAVQEQCVLDNGYYKCYSRMSRLQDAFYLLLNGGRDLKGEEITKLSDDKVIGLSTLGVYVDSAVDTGRMVVPARRLDAMVNGKTQRQILTDEMSKFTARTNTPTARSFAEVVAYFMGTNTTNVPSNYQATATQYLYIPGKNARYKCDNTHPTRCNMMPSGLQRILYNTDIIGSGRDPNESRLSWTNYPIGTTSATNAYTSMPGYTYVIKPTKVYGRSGFQYSDPLTKNGSNYASPLDGDSCAAQGVYVLTDGEPTQDSGSEGLFASAFGEKITCPDTGDSLYCAITASEKLLSGNHKKKVPIKTAVVGFGAVFTKIPSYDAALTKEENLKNVGVTGTDVTTIDNLPSNDKEQRRAAAWGIVGGGGWYSGSSTVSVVNSVNSFLQTLNTDIPSMATGSPTVPVSSLNRQSLSSQAYYASFAPQPDKTQQLWTGNMNKYNTINGSLYGQGNQSLFQTSGLIDQTTLGLWDREINGETASGVFGNLKLRTNEQNQTQRQVYTESTGDNRALTTVTVDSLRNGQDNNKNYWLNLLGYKVSENETVDFNQLSAKPELRQLGATMHSSPILLTQSGKINSQLEESNRDDYLVYGSTQGVLHIVDADTGEEKFAFVPQKMVEKQKQAFLHESNTSGGKEKLFYGIDGAWVAHTEYVPRPDDGALTVGLSNPSDANSAKGKQWIYGGLRMGGKNYYSLDLSSIANTAKQGQNDGQISGAPVLKFNIDPEAGAVYTSSGKKSYPELTKMGQSWSKPSLGYVRWNGERRLVMFVGGGYDVGYEQSDYAQTNGEGAGVYMFDANTGDLLWWASNNDVTGGKATKHSATGDDNGSLQYSVVSRINTIDRDSDGLIDALYFGDLAGQGFRIDLNNANKINANGSAEVPFSIRVVKIFDEHKNDGLSPRLYEMPSISVQEAEGIGRFAVAAFGSGDRSSPLAGNYERLKTNLNTADDSVFVVYDYDLGNTAWRTMSMGNLLTHHGKGALKTAVLDSNLKGTEREVKADGKNQGWKYAYPTEKKGRYKAFGEPYAITNLLFVNTYDRDGGGLSGACGAGVVGVSQAYQFCLPTGICEKDEHGYVRNEETPVVSSSTPGLVEMTLGLGEKGVGNLSNISANSSSADSSASSNVKIDCSKTENQSKPECLNVETPSILSQLRWFESRQEQSQN